MYPLFHILNVENFFTRLRCSVSVKYINFTDRIISLQTHHSESKNYRFSVSLECDDCYAVFTLAIDTETA